MDNCVLTVERTTKDPTTFFDSESLRVKTDNHVVYLDHKRMKEMKITAKNNLLLIKGKDSKIVVCQVQKSTGGATDYCTIYLNKLVRHNLGVIRGDVVMVQTCKNCPTASLIEISLFSNNAIKNLTLESFRAIVIKHFIYNPSVLCKGNKFIIHGHGHEPIVFSITQIDDGRLYCLANPKMIILISKKLDKYDASVKPLADPCYDDIGGYRQQLDKLKKIEFALRFSSLYKHFIQDTLPTVIFSGCSGVGKSLFVQALANETGVPLIRIDGGEFSKEFKKEGSVAYLTKKFEEAKRKSPSILHLDKMEEIVPKESLNSSEIAEVFYNFLDQKLPVVMIGETSDQTAINQNFIELFYSLSMDCFIEFYKPDILERRNILLLHSKNIPFSVNFDFLKVASDMEAGTGADIAQLCKKVFISKSYPKVSSPCTNLDFLYLSNLKTN